MAIDYGFSIEVLLHIVSTFVESNFQLKFKFDDDLLVYQIKLNKIKCLLKI